MYLLLLVSSAIAQEYAEVWIEAPDPQSRVAVKEAGFGFVEQQEGPWYLFHGPEEQLPLLSVNGLRWRHHHLELQSGSQLPYSSADDVNNTLWAWQQEFPAIAKVVNLGQSHAGQPILALGIGNPESPRMQWRILGTHHGDEASSTLVAMHIAELLLDSHAEDSSIAELLERDVIWVVPMVNPDGYDARSRYNAAGVDLNRNYEYQWSASEWAAGLAPFSEPETRAIRSLSDWTGFGAGLSIHSGAVNLGWVWNYSNTATDDDALLQEMAVQYADQCFMENFWTTNGADWYITNGDTNDWSYGRHGTLDFTLEVSVNKSPPPEEWGSIIDGHSDAIIGFIQTSQIVAGTVVDETTGQGIPASISIDGQPITLQTDNAGRFGRPVGPGEHTIQFSAPGYDPLEMSLSAGDVAVDVQLAPSALLDLHVEPAILSQSGDGYFELNIDPTQVTLTRPGHPNINALPVKTGWKVSLEGVAPGPWNIDTEDGVAPRVIFVGERDARVEILTAEVDALGTIRLTGHDFGEGSQAWALSGSARNPIPLELIYGEADVLELVYPFSEAEDEFDIWLITQGYQLAVLQLYSSSIVDTGEPSEKGADGTSYDSGGPSQSGLSDSGNPAELSGCACTARVHTFPIGGLTVSLGILGIAIRRRV